MLTITPPATHSHAKHLHLYGLTQSPKESSDWPQAALTQADGH